MGDWMETGLEDSGVHSIEKYILVHRRQSDYTKYLTDQFACLSISMCLY